MVSFNYAAREVTAKIVYYGPGLCGKTTNLEELHKKMNPQTRGKMVSLATDTDRTLFFDLLPVDLGTVGGFRTKLQLFTVPGQTYYNNTRKLVLKGADGVVFVADSQAAQMQANIESYQNLAENLKENGLDINTLPLVLQWNKQDLPDLSPVEELEKTLNPRNVPTQKAVAFRGEGVLETFKLVSREVMKALQSKVGGQSVGAAPVREKKVERADAAPLKVQTEQHYQGAASDDQVKAEASLERHGIEGGKRYVEELAKLAAELKAAGDEDAAAVIADLRKNVAGLIEDQRRVEFRYQTMLRQVNKLVKLMSARK